MPSHSIACIVRRARGVCANRRAAAAGGRRGRACDGTRRPGAARGGCTGRGRPASNQGSAAQCFPPCREGYVCHQRQCISALQSALSERSSRASGGSAANRLGWARPAAIREPPLPPPVKPFADRGFFMLGFHYGFSGDLRGRPADQSARTDLRLQPARRCAHRTLPGARAAFSIQHLARRHRSCAESQLLHRHRFLRSSAITDHR